MTRCTMARPDAGALELVGTVQALKDSEQLVDVLHVKTRPVVAYEIDGLPLRFTANINNGRIAIAGVFDGVG